MHLFLLVSLDARCNIAIQWTALTHEICFLDMIHLSRHDDLLQHLAFLKHKMGCFVINGLLACFERLSFQHNISYPGSTKVISFGGSRIWVALEKLQKTGQTVA